MKKPNRIPFQKGSSNPQTRYEDRVRELETEIERFKKITMAFSNKKDCRDTLFSLYGRLDGLKEGYSLGKQDMITEIEKKGKTNAGQRFTTCDNDIFIDCFEWQALKKREGIE